MQPNTIYLNMMQYKQAVMQFTEVFTVFIHCPCGGICFCAFCIEENLISNILTVVNIKTALF